MTASAPIALPALVSVGIFIELAYIQRTKLARFFGPIARAILPQALYNRAPRLNSKELRALERRTAAGKRQIMVRAKASLTLYSHLAPAA